MSASDAAPTPAPATLPSPPFVHIAGIPNLRDIGGYPTPALRPGHVIRRGVVFRSAAPSTELAELPQSLGHLYDLRSNDELVKHPPPASAVAAGRHSHVPVFAEEAYTPEAIVLRFRSYMSADGTEGFVAAYLEMLQHGSQHGAFASVLRHVAAPVEPTEEPRPLLVHCTAGKDRTGLTCALLLSLCGVSDEDVATEYGLTELGLAEQMPVFVENLKKYPALNGDIDGIRRMLGARPDAMIATLEWLRKEHGSIEGFIRHCGLTEEEIARIRDNMIVKSDAA